MDYSAIMHKAGMKDAAEYLVLQALEKVTTEVRTMVEEADEDVPRIWTILPENLVGTPQNIWHGKMNFHAKRWRTTWNLQYS